MKENILIKASKLVDGGNREGLYGKAEDNMNHIAKIFNAITGKHLTGSDIALINIAQKLSRESYKHKEDNLIDLAGYSYVLNECKKNENDEELPF